MKAFVLKVDANKPNPEDIEKAVEVLKKGGLIAFPTDTVYGIGADIFDKDAIERIFSAKGRDSRKPLQVLIADKNDLGFIAGNQSDILYSLVKKFMPGALTIVMSAKSDFPKWVTCGLDTVGVRMPANVLALEMIKALADLSPLPAQIYQECPIRKTLSKCLNTLIARLI